MPNSEFDLIHTYFSERVFKRKDVVAGIGDDCALIELPENSQLAVSTDTLVSGVHFFPDVAPKALGHKAAAVNLSDLAAMGAEPGWISLALTLPEFDRSWLDAFSQGFLELCEYFGVSLVGGDTTKGPLSITVSVKGTVPKGKALLRSGAKPGDWIYVSGFIGDAALGLDLVLGKQSANSADKEHLISRLEYPTPRILLGRGLRDVASSAIDISDGLAQDLGHILKTSGCGAYLELENLPFSDAMINTVELTKAIKYGLCGGDDYEVLFTVPEDKKGALDTSLAHCGVQHTCIGRVQTGEKLELKLNGDDYQAELSGWDHFTG